ncbi:CRISPR-associated protein, Csd1 family [Saccharopolyspora shandongensis]|uniref:CRISPR-associated protein, Csd1 family n=1 Tax=Saccharopolyspora shandongensis TaxID=418495 RepID=A0A1H3TLF7_9PSEU|nr:type I-C CRISPR-associated protein Cas8c/Csd1 [Saccharopolyspora shandongensis]SDZ50827.1 CRISPR-associated protein, Csd1 family [Saccharopolyspora shandongensis]
MLLNRLADYADTHCDTSRPFHSVYEFHWQLDIRTRNAEFVEARLTPLADESGNGRGIPHEVPAIVRTSGVEPFLVADDVQYVLGWSGQGKDDKRARECHKAFLEIVQQWADSPEGTGDEIAHAIAQFYRSGGPSKLSKPEEVTAKQRVLIAVNGQPAYEASSVVPFWIAEVIRRKGTGKSGLCLVCGETEPLLKTMPVFLPAKLVPGADSRGAALVSINNPVFGYDLTEQLVHVPICVYCCNAVPVGLIEVLDSGHILTHSGQDSRTTWWLVNPGIDIHADHLDEPDADTITTRLHSVWNTDESDLEEHLDDESLGLFCSISVGGNRSRVMVQDWIEMPLARLERNIRHWFRDHEIQPQWPDGKRVHGITSFAKVFGRWDSQRQRYAPFDARNADRPRYVARALQRSAFRKAPLAPALRAHLVHRICRDGHVDDCRAALIRLALNRNASREETSPVSPGLDHTYQEPAYLAGRLFAVLAQLQQAANTDLNKKAGTNEERPRLNTTYADRFFAGAARNPRAALVSGRLDAKAWFSKLRRGGHHGLAAHFENQLTAIYAMLEATDGVPSTNNLRQQEQFILGYHHQRADRSNKNPPAEPGETTSTQPA